MSKKCSKCKGIKEIREFGKNKSSKDGLSCWCKRCHVLAALKSRKTEEGAKKHKKANEKYRHSEKGREASRRGNKKHNMLHPERKKARQIAANAVRSGILVKEPCYCGEIEVEGHHKDYSKPLEVEWLCTKHHKELNKKGCKMDSKLTTEEALVEEFQKRFSRTPPGMHPSEARYLVDLIIDLIAERSEDEAEEAVDSHERKYDHDSGT